MLFSERHPVEHEVRDELGRVGELMTLNVDYQVRRSELPGGYVNGNEHHLLVALTCRAGRQL